ncbi:MAG: hypothetical protein U1F43_21235 [Myxococcota bacterium]
MTNLLASARLRTRALYFVLTALGAPASLAAFAAISACGGDGNGTKPTCTAGTEDCACATGNTCGTGLTCEANVCVPDEVVTPDCGTAVNCMAVTVPSGDARACDLVVQTTGRKVAEVVYPTGMKGAMRTRDLKTAIAVIKTDDSALTGVVAKVMFEGDAAVAGGEASVAKTTCYDKTGAPLTGITATLH